MNTENPVDKRSDGIEECELDFRYYILRVLNSDSFCV